MTNEFTSKGSLDIHVKRLHDGIIFEYKCDKCEKTFPHQSSLHAHKKTIHENVRHFCKLCDTSYSENQGLKRHIEAIHLGVPLKKNFRCDLCDKKYSSTSHLSHHKNTEHKKIRYKCEVCEKVYKSKFSLEQHLDSAHKDIPFSSKCKEENCDKTYTTFSGLRYHMRKLHNIKLMYKMWKK